MKRNQHITAFYLETLLMIAVFISIILVLTRVFGGAAVQSMEAKNLTASVTLAQNTAEAVSASRTPEELLDTLDQNGNTEILNHRDERSGDGTGTVLVSLYDAGMEPVPITEEISGQLQEQAASGETVSLPGSGTLIVQTSWTPSGEEGREDMVDAVISVLNGNTGSQLFAIDTAVYRPQTP